MTTTAARVSAVVVVLVATLLQSGCMIGHGARNGRLLPEGGFVGQLDGRLAYARQGSRNVVGGDVVASAAVLGATALSGASLGDMTLEYGVTESVTGGLILGFGSATLGADARTSLFDSGDFCVSVLAGAWLNVWNLDTVGGRALLMTTSRVGESDLVLNAHVAADLTHGDRIWLGGALGVEVLKTPWYTLMPVLDYSYLRGAGADAHIIALVTAVRTGAQSR